MANTLGTSILPTRPEPSWSPRATAPGRYLLGAAAGGGSAGVAGPAAGDRRREVLLGPAAPRGRQLGRVEQAGHELALAVVGARNHADADLVVGPVHHLERVAGGDLPLPDDREVGARAHGGSEAPRERLVAHADAQLVAGDPGRGDLQDGAADGPALADQGGARVEPGDGEVVAEGPRPDGATQGRRPPAVVVQAVGVQGLLRAAVGAPVGLL